MQSDGVLKNSCVYKTVLAYMQFIVFKQLVKTEDLLLLQMLHSLVFHSLISILKKKNKHVILKDLFLIFIINDPMLRVQFNYIRSTITQCLFSTGFVGWNSKYLAQNCLK